MLIDSEKEEMSNNLGPSENFVISILFFWQKWSWKPYVMLGIHFPHFPLIGNFAHVQCTIIYTLAPNII